ncbi:MAG: class I SAM-dependent methyltransferase [Polyangiaceae bacterium]
MPSSWDKAAAGYLSEWVPRFRPYHRDLADELALTPGASALVVSAGPGAEAQILARAVAPGGRVVATDSSPEMIRLSQELAERAGLSNELQGRVADCADTLGEKWDAIVCAFGLWQIEDAERTATIAAWSKALKPSGKVAILVWGPEDPTDPFEQLESAFRRSRPDYPIASRRPLASRERLQEMFETAGLSVVRCTVLRHTQVFERAEMFVHSISTACGWRGLWEELGQERLEQLAAPFYEAVGGPTTPLSFAPAATLCIAALPGAEVSLGSRPSARAPKL